MNKNNKLLENSKEFAILIIKTFDFEKYDSLNNQILRSGTSIGANIREAQYAQSMLDFINKLEIALKECYETEYWLEIFYKTERINENSFLTLRNKAGLLRKLLISSIKSAKSQL